MRTLEAIGVVQSDHTMTIRMPDDVPAGSHQIVLVFNDAAAMPNLFGPRTLTLNPHPVGPVDPNCTYRREDLYGDDGR